MSDRRQRARVLLRLSDEERETFDLLLSALKVSEYTNEVDGTSSYRREEIMKTAMSELFTTIVGLSHVADALPRDVVEKIANRSYLMKDIEPILANAFEIARRFKRINPDKMRSEYGKLVMLLQDLHCFPRVGFDFSKIVIPVKTVGQELERLDAVNMLDDARLDTAVAPLPARAGPDAVAAKTRAREELLDAFGGILPPGSPTALANDEAAQAVMKKRSRVERVIRSLDDAAAFVDINTRPLRKLLGYLERFKETDNKGMSLAISNGKSGACLTHSHSQQYGYVREALSLWKEVHENIFDFWETVERDMVLSGAGYRWRNTGQGFARVCGGPDTYDRMMKAISTTHQRLGGWVGSKVVHLGDNDVPNPLVFIDKYTIIPNLVNPIVAFVESLEDIFAAPTEPYPGIRFLLLGDLKSHETLRDFVLRDFFRHGFDGSGDDGGSCIDGRLTSAWNWCSLLHKKPYYATFQLTGFSGFDANYS